MKSYFLLLRLNLRNLLAGFRGAMRKPNGKIDISRLILYPLALLGMLTLAGFVIFMEFSMFSAFEMLNAPEMLPGLAILLAMVTALLFSVFQMLAALYFSRDTASMAYLPLTSRTVLAAKWTEVYVSELLFSLLIAAPAVVLYGIHYAADWTYYLRMVPVLLAAFLLWALLTRRFAAAGGVAALAAGLAATSLMGGYLVYYGLVLAVFAPLGLVPLVRLAEKTPAPVRTALPWAVLAACAAACYALTPNRALRGRARADLPQYRFAAQINGGSLLNYGTLDGGFYTAAGVLPPCKYFCVTNMPLDDQWTDQQAVLKAGAVDYVVALTGDLHGDFPQYAVIDRCSYDGGEGEVTWYLYQLQR